MVLAIAMLQRARRVRHAAVRPAIPAFRASPPSPPGLSAHPPPSSRAAPRTSMRRTDCSPCPPRRRSGPRRSGSPWAVEARRVPPAVTLPRAPVPASVDTLPVASTFRTRFLRVRRCMVCRAVHAHCSRSREGSPCSPARRAQAPCGRSCPCPARAREVVRYAAFRSSRRHAPVAHVGDQQSALAIQAAIVRLDQLRRRARPAVARVAALAGPATSESRPFPST